MGSEKAYVNYISSSLKQLNIAMSSECNFFMQLDHRSIYSIGVVLVQSRLENIQIEINRISNLNDSQGGRRYDHQHQFFLLEETRS
jgi:hypothetical protein